MNAIPGWSLTETFFKLFKQVGNPTHASTALLKSLQKDYEKLPNPYAFQLAINVRPNATITWCNNLKHLLGEERMNFSSYIEKIHPDWSAIYWEFVVAMYRKSREFGGGSQNRNWSYFLKVPLKDASGKYSWYSQSIVPVEFDSKGQMVSHLSVYSYLEPYQSYRPGGPKFLIDGQAAPGIQQSIRRMCEQRVFERYFHQLRPYEMNALNVMRDLHESSSNGKMDVEAVSRTLGVSRHAVYKYSYRIMEITRDYFPVPRIKTVEELAKVLNALFGPPALSKS